MGLFSDICNALIDKETGRALTGEALLEAQKDPKWPTCGNRVSKRARFCNKCGKPAPGGWWKCPGCGKWIGNDSHFCPHCNTPLYPEDRVAMAGGVWRKEPEYYAQRFEVGDIKRELIQKLQVQEGTAAILMDSGEVSDVLPAGAHEVDSLVRRINWFGNPPPRSVVLIDAGEVIVPLHIESLRTAEHFPIEFFGEVIFRFQGGKDAARAFTSNVLKSERLCTFQDIAKRLEPVIRVPVDEMCTVSSLDDLVRDPERRIRLQERMTARIKDDLDACGLEVVRVSSAEFTGDEYEAHAERLGELEAKRLGKEVDVEDARREAEYRAALRRLADREEMDKFKDAEALRTYKETIDHEFRVSHATRDREFDLLKRDWEHDDIVYRRLLELENLEHQQEMANREQAHQHGLEDRQVDHDIATGRKMDGYVREKKVEGAKADTAAQDLHSQQDIKDALGWLGVRAEKQRLHIEAKAAEASRRSGMAIEQLLADIEDPQQREQMLRLYQMKLQAGMTPQQILATMGQVDHNDEFLAKMQELYKENATRIDTNYAKFLEPAIEAARHPSNVTGPFIK